MALPGGTTSYILPIGTDNDVFFPVPGNTTVSIHISSAAQTVDLISRVVSEEQYDDAGGGYVGRLPLVKIEAAGVAGTAAIYGNATITGVQAVGIRLAAPSTGEIRVEILAMARVR